MIITFTFLELVKLFLMLLCLIELEWLICEINVLYWRKNVIVARHCIKPIQDLEIQLSKSCSMIFLNSIWANLFQLNCHASKSFKNVSSLYF